ncbi:hypothetical protein CHUAL_011957 [Chamberlinius hualienensis]
MHTNLLAAIVLVVVTSWVQGDQDGHTSNLDGPNKVPTQLEEESLVLGHMGEEGPMTSSEELTDESMEKRGWGDLQAAWGKRAWNDLQTAWGKRGWRDFPASWGKRGWQNFQGSWGKRDNDWRAFRGSWGKREPSWNNLKGLWGKRADNNWAKLNGLWGKRAVAK